MWSSRVASNRTKVLRGVKYAKSEVGINWIQERSFRNSNFNAWVEAQFCFRMNWQDDSELSSSIAPMVKVLPPEIGRFRKDE